MAKNSKHLQAVHSNNSGAIRTRNAAKHTQVEKAVCLLGTQSEYAGTGIIVGRQLILTANHVWETLNRVGPKYVILPERIDDETEVSFTELVNRAKVKNTLIRITQISVYDSTDKNDYRFLRTDKPIPEQITPLPLCSKELQTDENVSLYAFPCVTKEVPADSKSTRPHREEENITVRVALGETPGVTHDYGGATGLIAHNCDSTGGSSGGALVTIEGDLVGLHVRGVDGQNNYAVPIYFILEHLIQSEHADLQAILKEIEISDDSDRRLSVQESIPPAILKLIPDSIRPAKSSTRAGGRSHESAGGRRTQSKRRPPRQNPFRGLLQFRENDRHLFFGRHKIAKKLATETRDGLRSSGAAAAKKRFIAVFGASGAGKSSLARAGVIPQLRDALEKNGQTLDVLEVRAKQDILDEFTRVLIESPPAGLTPQDGDFSAVRDELVIAGGFRAVLDRRYPPGGNRCCLVLVDQFEEMYQFFTISTWTQPFIIFFEGLASCVTSEAGNWAVLLTCRDDHYHQFQKIEPLAPLIYDSKRTEFLRPPERHDLLDLIKKPISQSGMEIESDVADALATEFSRIEGSLSVLQVALYRLWDIAYEDPENVVPPRITSTHYQSLGGWQRVITAHAEEVMGLYERKSFCDENLCRCLLLKLVRLTDGLPDMKARKSWLELQPRASAH